ncbi:MAG: hypothetical protein AAGD11_20450, partial [Planctomycetota bacterium]
PQASGKSTPKCLLFIGLCSFFGIKFPQAVGLAAAGNYLQTIRRKPTRRRLASTLIGLSIAAIAVAD